MAAALDRGRECFERRAWAEAFAQLAAADHESPLEPEDLERLATAAYMIGREDDSADAGARAHHELLRRGRVPEAVRGAFWVAFGLLSRGEAARGGGWLARARRLLDDLGQDRVEHGYLLFPVGMERLASGDAATAAATFEEAAEVGQAGLAAGHHLARRGRRFVILDAERRVGDTWRRRWDSLRLFTPARYCGLPGMAFPAPGFSYPTKDEVADFLEAYAARFDLPVRLGVRVERLAREGGRYLVAAGDRRLEADHVVVATGAYQRPRIPAFAAELDPDVLQLDPTRYRDPSRLPPGGVLVVGAGNSGAEIAFEVARTHPTWLSGPATGHLPVRTGGRADRLLTPPFWWFASRVLTVQTPIGRRVRPRALTTTAPLERVRPRELAAAGVARVPRTVGVRGGAPLLEDGRVMEVATVVWCTGFRPDFVLGGVGRDAEHVAAQIAAPAATATGRP